ncbi:hypothetical protein [Embleya sp. NPDC020886]|uniref:hypothetical protein n=1 Tax=Embleya sp. NPDC020886 TaxID=3363980 RepID=UPI0037B31648
MRARAREESAWTNEFGIRYSLDEDPTEVGPLQAAEYANGTGAIYAKYSDFHRDYYKDKLRVQAVLGVRDAVILLLRRLSGRLSDDAEAALWVGLADSGPSVAGPHLLDRVAAEQVRLTPAERQLVDDIGADPAGFGSAAEFTIAQDDVEILYYFDPTTVEPRNEMPIVLDGIDDAIVDTAAGLPVSEGF